MLNERRNRAPAPDLEVTERLDKLEKKNRGILITLDEVQASSLPEMRSLATAVQHLIRERRNVAFVFAGLPSMVEDVINDDVLTFLRRAERRHLGDVPLAEVRKAFQETITQNSKHADADTLDTLAQATNGYPFMIQLVGYWAWRDSQANTRDSQDELTIENAREGIKQAKIKLGDMVHGPALDGLSAMGRDYLLAMSQDDGPSSPSATDSAISNPPIGRTPADTGQPSNNYRHSVILVHPAGGYCRCESDPAARQMRFPRCGKTSFDTQFFSWVSPLR